MPIKDEEVNIEVNFCRRCGTKLQNKQSNMYVCEQNHTLFVNSSPATGVWLLNEKDEVLVMVRADEPGKGMYDAPGGFCDGYEKLEDAAARELEEEMGLKREDYSELQYVLSGNEAYRFGGETMPVLTAMFTARIVPGRKPMGNAEVASLAWIPVKEVDLDKVYFPVVRAALKQLQETA